MLIPILFEAVDPPIVFRALHTENFVAWNGNINSDEFKKLQRAIANLVQPTNNQQEKPKTDKAKPDADIGSKTEKSNPKKLEKSQPPAWSILSSFKPK